MTSSKAALAEGRPYDDQVEPSGKDCRPQDRFVINPCWAKNVKLWSTEHGRRHHNGEEFGYTASAWQAVMDDKQHPQLQGNKKDHRRQARQACEFGPRDIGER